MNLLINYIIDESKVLSEAPVLSFLLIVLGFIIAKLFYKETVKHALEQKKNEEERLKEEKEKVSFLINELEEKDSIIKAGEFSSLLKKNDSIT